MRLIALAIWLTASLAASLSSAKGAEPADHAWFADRPNFDPLRFFEGHTRSWGVIESRDGAPTQSIVTESSGERDSAGRLHMVQRLRFDDGTTQQRDWVMWRSGPDRFDATANDMVGIASGQVTGRVFRWQWVLARSPGNALMNVTMQQWMYHMDDGTVTIRTTVSKLGFILAEVTEQFTRPESGMALSRGQAE